jgi:hypothetical protein
MLMMATHEPLNIDVTHSESLLHEAFAAAPTILIFALVLLFLGLFWEQIRSILVSLAWRIKVGAPIKIGAVEVGAVHAIRADKVTPAEQGAGVERDNGTRDRERRGIYATSKGVMLVHTLFRSAEPGQLFDLYIYVVPHKAYSLASVTKVEYYLGPKWGHKVFPSSERFNGFAIFTSAYGPFLCTAEITYTGGEKHTISRYIDFEMGANAPARLPDTEDDRGPKKNSRIRGSNE